MFMTLRWIGSLAAVVALSAPISAAAQNTAKPELIGVAHIALRVSDVDAEVQFLGKMGFDLAFDHQQNGKRAFVFVKISDDEFLEVAPNPPQEAPPLGFNHICFVTTNANEEYAKWAEAGLNPTKVAPGPDNTLEFGAKSPTGAMVEALEIVPESQPGQDMGKHLGANRVSTWMKGVELPVADIPAMQKFYQSIGFVATKHGAAVEMNWPGKADLEVLLRPAGPNEQSEVLLSVANLNKAAEQLRGGGMKVEMLTNRAIVHDPDGMAFVLMEKAAKGK
jgi:catechol 2,3-dioxygenase-like lactoylglutathione lyase family enzyme